MLEWNFEVIVLSTRTMCSIFCYMVILKSPAIRHSFTAWKLSKYGVFSGLCFPVFGLNTEIPRDLRDPYNSLSLPIVSESLSLKNACFLLAVINFEASYLAFFYILKILSLAFSFSKTSLSSHFWVFTFIRLFK